MKRILEYLVAYWKATSLLMVIIPVGFAACMIFFNYHFGWNDLLNDLPFFFSLAGWYILLGSGFWISYLATGSYCRQIIKTNPNFLVLLLLAPLVFAQKMTLPLSFSFTGNMLQDGYYNAVIAYPLRLIILTGLTRIVMAVTNTHQIALGFTVKGFSLRPYILMLLFMIPLVALASTQADFLHMYPRMNNIAYLRGAGHNAEKILYQLSYGTDFISIELFFRGFLVLVFAKFAGQRAILPMAVFYCFIHFGKPLGECISSLFGGMLLGVVTYRTRSIVGGLVVHLGIAWLMELGGYIGRLYL